MINVKDYDRTVIAFSGGKDSLACLLHAIKAGCKNIELWHHEIDGREGSTLMDWTVTPDYCKKVAEAMNIPIYFSWLEGGFEREMLRDNQKKAATWFEVPAITGLTYTKKVGGTRGKNSTRRKFPQVSGDLKVRWCSAYLKIDVCDIAIRNQARFNHSKTLVLSGERAEESPQRAKYKTFELDRADNRDGKNQRHIDRWRPVHSFKEAEVWDLIAEFKINPHPAYRLGWGRLSCMSCIFGSANQWASVRRIAPAHFQKIFDYEKEFGVTIRRDKNVVEIADTGESYSQTTDINLIELALSPVYYENVFVEHWVYPAGAFGESDGPS